MLDSAPTKQPGNYYNFVCPYNEQNWSMDMHLSRRHFDDTLIETEAINADYFENAKAFSVKVFKIALSLWPTILKDAKGYSENLFSVS